MELKVFSGSSNLPLAEKICRYLNIPLGNVTLKTFSDGEVFVEINENVRGMDVFVIQSTSTPGNHYIMELLIMIDALKRASAKRITAVVPYYGYARQDRKVAPRTPISAKLVADLFTAAGANRILTMDLHAGQIQGFFNVPVDHLYATPVLLKYIATNFKDNIVIVSPDAGGVERARAYAKRLECGLAIIDKRRVGMNVAEIMNIIGEVEGKVAVLVDDMVDTAGTITQAADAIMNKGAKEVYACCTHPVLSGNAVERLEKSVIKKMIVTDTIQLNEKAKNSSKIVVLSIAELLGEAIKRIHEETSISSLFV
jgi:ribose-phosphate pyrophosphokinase